VKRFALPSSLARELPLRRVVDPDEEQTIEAAAPYVDSGSVPPRLYGGTERVVLLAYGGAGRPRSRRDTVRGMGAVEEDRQFDEEGRGDAARLAAPLGVAVGFHR
jgi:hypothetical protein